jgi:crotonobetainyl-CoA:carnitine CoA-transferase CaiB-like acyl-CoA transferase
MTIAEGPLAGVQILAIEQFGAGPFCSLQFAHLGADVVKIEDPSTAGDVGRRVPPGVAGDGSLYFETFNRGKRSIALDLKKSAGREVLERLVVTSDAVFNNLRGDQPARLRLTYESLGAINPAIVCASLSAFGNLGDRAAEPGYDALIQAEAGWAAITGEPDGPPIRSGLPLVDYSAGFAAAFGMLAAIFKARQTGIGCDVETNLYDTALSLLNYPATWYLSASVPFERQAMSAHPSIVPFQFFQTADGCIAIACAKEKFFETLVETLNADDLAADRRFATFADRLEHREALLERLSAMFEQRPSAHWVELLRGRVPCAPVREPSEALALAELRERGMLVEYEHPHLGAVRTVGPAVRVDGFQADAEPAPGLGADRDEILLQAGYSHAQIERLADEGAFGGAVRSR